MNKNKVNLLVDVITFLIAIGMVGTGLVIRFALPPGTGGRHGGGGLVLWGLGRHDWGDLHFWMGAVMAGLLLIHVALHWSWVCTMVRRCFVVAQSGRPSTLKQASYGVGLALAVAVLFGGFTWYANSAVLHSNPLVQAEDAQQHADAGSVRKTERGGEALRGSMTLAELETATGVSAELLRSELGLPQTTSANERLGRLARTYGFSMDRVRQIVSAGTSRARCSG